MNNPLISVVMPAFNAEKSVLKAAQSILNQTHTNLELIIVDDGSTDSTGSIIVSLADPRIIYIKNDKNLGQTESLNQGIQAAEGTYIARMDADDESMLDRLEEQVGYMEEHPEADLCGTYIKIKKGFIPVVPRYPSSHELIWACLLFFNPIAHPTFLVRKKLFEIHGYEPSFTHAQDYEFLTRKNRSYALIEKPLLAYSINDSSLSRQEPMQCDIQKVWERNLKALGVEQSEKVLQYHKEISLALERSYRHGKIMKYVRPVSIEALAYFENLIEANKQADRYSPVALASLFDRVKQ